MKIKSKLILAFLAIGIIPMVIAVYAAVHIYTQLLAKENQKKIETAKKAVELANTVLFKRTVSAGTLILGNEKIKTAVLKRDKRLLEEELTSILRKALVHQIVYLRPEELDKFRGDRIKESYGMAISLPFVWQGFLLGEIEEKKGIMAVSVVEIKKNEETICGFQIGHWFDSQEVIEQIKELTGGVEIHAMDTTEFISHVQIDQKGYDELFKKLSPFYTDYAKIDNLPYQVYFIPLKGLAKEVVGILTLRIPKAEVLGIWKEYQSRFYAITIGLGSLVAIGIGYLIAKSISEPIIACAKGAEAIAQGNLNYKIDIKSKDEIGELAKAFNVMTKKILESKELEQQMYMRDKLVSLGKLSAGLAHEIGNPLNIIKTSAVLLEKKVFASSSDKTAIKQLLENIIEETNRLDQLVTTFLAFARPGKLEFEKSNINDLVKHSINLARLHLVIEKYEIVESYQPEEKYVLVNPNQIQQVFLNLILNACEAMPNGGRLEIRTFIPNDRKNEIAISFTDSGPGIDEETQKKIFEPFYSTKENGIGLGLAISKQIITAHNGRITLSSKVGVGSTFTIYLPLCN